jgi:hypothetical protein
VLINAEISRFPADGRRTERRIVNIAAALRENGATTDSVILVDLSIGGFKAETKAPHEEGAEVWLKLPGFAPRRSRVAWNKEEVIGCEFETPLHGSELEAMSAPPSRAIRKGIFGPRR